jgi:O-antigen/teichoic acid export membrane protein
VYTAFLSPTDYGQLALLILFSTLAKVLFRLGLDAGFFRVYYDLDAGERPRFVSSVTLFAAGSSTLLFLGVLLARDALAGALLLPAGRGGWVVLAAADVYLGAFSFVPQALLRIQDRPGGFAAFAILRHATNAALKVWFLVQGRGVGGVVLADALATGLFAVALSPVLLRAAARGWTPGPLLEALRFGLPKVPHGLMLQLQNLADRRILAAFVPRAEVGLYNQGYALGQGVKFALSAFEPAWQPFVYAQIGRPEAPRAIARVVTYVWAGFLAAGLALAVLGRELLMLLTYKNPAFWAAAPVIPVVVLAYLLHGAFLLTSVGIAIAKQARYYPLVTAITAALNIAANLLLVPRFGMLGAAWATVVSYAAMAGLGFVLSRRLYPIPFEASRLLRLAAAAGLGYLVSLLAPSALVPAVAVKLVALALFPAAVVAFGVLSAEEWERGREWLRGRRASS